MYQYEGKVEDLNAKIKELEDKLSRTANLSEAEKNQILKEMQDLKTQLEYEKIKNDDLSKKITELENIIKTKDSKIGSLQLEEENLSKIINDIYQQKDNINIEYNNKKKDI